ncbi:hypothetical protein SDJN03_14792, partial [Cucurbita argyrosperma subsp. sororia]
MNTTTTRIPILISLGSPLTTGPSKASRKNNDFVPPLDAVLMTTYIRPLIPLAIISNRTASHRISCESAAHQALFICHCQQDSVGSKEALLP